MHKYMLHTYMLTYTHIHTEITIDRQTDRQTDRHIYIHACIHAYFRCNRKNKDKSSVNSIRSTNNNLNKCVGKYAVKISLYIIYTDQTDRQIDR